MAINSFFRSRAHLNADPALRAAGVAELPPDSEELAGLLSDDPVPEVRIAAANRCASLGALAAAWENEADPAVRAALVPALAGVLAGSQDEGRVMAWIDSPVCTDSIRAELARRTADAQRRRGAIASIRDEPLLIELALGAEHAETRLAAAERVRTPEGLRKLAEASRDKDRGVARLARKRGEAMADRESQLAEADAIAAQLEALAEEPGPILTAVIELNRRWEALELGEDRARVARCEAARQKLQERFDREHDEQRSRARFEQRLNDWLARRDPPESMQALDGLRDELAELQELARTAADDAALSRLEEAQQRLEAWALQLQALAGAEALVIEAERLAASTSIDNASLPQRWEALDRKVRTPALTRRFEAALIVVEQRRLEHVRVAEQETQAARQQVHALLHAGEQALAAGQLQAARAALEAIRARKPDAGMLPKPTLQRLGHLTHQLTELERWESFGQQQARLRLCERAEAATAAGATLDPPQLAREVQALRNEWKALDQQHAGVPKALWERFDRACEKAYAPAARHFAEQAAQRKQARSQREEFIAAAAAHAPTLLSEPHDWRAIERWLRETEQRWRGGELGSLEPKAWKTFDARLKAALAPLRDALSVARGEAKAARLGLIEEAKALAAKAAERDAPAQVKAIQARWQAHARELAIAQRDEQALWEQFRAACDAVFSAREARRKQDGDVRQEGRRAIEDICAQAEQLAQPRHGEGEQQPDEQQLRRALRDLQDQWRQKARASDPAQRGLEARFNRARIAVEALLSARVRDRQTAVWRTLAAKERLCEELDGLLRSAAGSADCAAVKERWGALPALPAEWEKAMLARRDTAIRALDGEAAHGDAYRVRMERGDAARRELLLEIEMLLGLDCPPELQAQRLALQVKQLRERFRSSATIGPATAGERLLAWCAQPGVADERDRQRLERVFPAIERAR